MQAGKEIPTPAVCVRARESEREREKGRKRHQHTRNNGIFKVQFSDSKHKPTEGSRLHIVGIPFLFTDLVSSLKMVIAIQ